LSVMNGKTETSSSPIHCKDCGRSLTLPSSSESDMLVTSMKPLKPSTSPALNAVNCSSSSLFIHYSY
jgi:hypothetical protein